MVIDTLAGIIAALKCIHVHDTCGVNNLHRMPGIIAEITSIIVASIGDRSGYLSHLTDSCLSGGNPRSNSTQSAYQAAALGMTLDMAIVGALVAGIVLPLLIFAYKSQDFDDDSCGPIAQTSTKF
ncbi:unnamed protein product [Adineta ricciae]|uniref:Ammonium transporter AmtB-like domain-containing protein n=1 Tax=Adineta ricciae TaxID=249248 RepID=A0A813S8I5_ADIRI|nr:unnamed protein product [Adineta ricciae]CAF1186085.1 unnamed protein product [Adineta ricciae]